MGLWGLPGAVRCGAVRTEGRAVMAKQGGRGWQPPWRNPKAYALQVTGAVILIVGLVVVDSLLLGLLGLLVILAGWYVSKRS